MDGDGYLQPKATDAPPNLHVHISQEKALPQPALGGSYHCRGRDRQWGDWEGFRALVTGARGLRVCMCNSPGACVCM